MKVWIPESMPIFKTMLFKALQRYRRARTRQIKHFISTLNAFGYFNIVANFVQWALKYKFKRTRRFKAAASSSVVSCVLSTEEEAAASKRRVLLNIYLSAHREKLQVIF